ncbi:hypothetical protein AB8613_23920 [Vibrio sp. BS-M-Sm-2]|uniref:hypothetical protein n=1 Tax=Vibrio sp. BS-M-Sm-2 TaxID=3241167 RepID=UPI003556B7E5
MRIRKVEEQKQKEMQETLLSMKRYIKNAEFGTVVATVQLQMLKNVNVLSSSNIGSFELCDKLELPPGYAVEYIKIRNLNALLISLGVNIQEQLEAQSVEKHYSQAHQLTDDALRKGKVLAANDLIDIYTITKNKTQKDGTKRTIAIEDVIYQLELYKEKQCNNDNK